MQETKRLQKTASPIRMGCLNAAIETVQRCLSADGSPHCGLHLLLVGSPTKLQAHIIVRKECSSGFGLIGKKILTSQ